MGCCCSCSAGRKTRRDQVQPDPSSVGNNLGAPPPYDAKIHDEPDDANTFRQEKPVQEPSILSASTTLHEKQGIRVGVKSTDHSLYCAAAGGHLDEVKRLLESGFNPSDRTICDWAPLHWAAHNDIEHGHEITKLLIEYGADPNQVSDTGLTPLDLARRANKTENAAFLESIGAQTGAQVRSLIKLHEKMWQAPGLPNQQAGSPSCKRHGRAANGGTVRCMCC